MCGIAGILSPNPEHRAAIERMTQALHHRGPDDAGHYHNGQITLGQTRLSIIDLETGHQPIHNEDDTLVLVCNGEIYNSPELRQLLIGKGHRFRTRTDVEVILHLYEEHGDDCVRHLQGMFAFALWDRIRQRLLLARDHMGQKPLFFTTGAGAIFFASEIKALLASKLVQPEMELEGLWHYMSLRFMPDQFSFFKNIQKLPAASRLTFEAGAARIERYWDIDFLAKHSGSEKEIEEGLHHTLLETVKSHMLSDVRVGAFLSGGIDSGTVSAMMASVQDQPVPVFSIGVKEQSFNELPYARMVAQRYGMEAHEEIVASDMIHKIPTMIHHMDEPSDPFGVGVYLVAQLARRTVKVALSGDGGDESFAGYDRFAGQRLADYYAVLPRWLRQTVMDRLIRLIPDSFQYKTIAQKARWLNEMSLRERGDRYAHSMSFLRFTDDSKRSLFTTQSQATFDSQDSREKILAHFNATNVNELVDRMLYTDLMTRMPDHLLVIADRMCMAHSLENRSPLVDHRLVEFAARIPGNMKLKGMKLKHILRSVSTRYLPRELVYREKQGFGFPIALWLRNDLSHFLRNLFAESRFVEAGIFDPQTVKMLLEEHLSGQVDHNFRLWILLNLELWYRMYFENASIDDMRETTDRMMRPT
jgi:asparagine synthase (glutamine-hydrolysing)